VVAVVAALAWETDEKAGSLVISRCTLAGSELSLTTAQASNAATIAAVARSRGLPQRATVIALATAQQESRLRNLPYGDRDSLGLFQQRPSQGWGSEAQVQDPVYAAGKFLDGLVRIPGWASGRLTDVAQGVQRSGFPQAYQKWEPMATELAAALNSAEPAQVNCSYTPVDAAGPLADRTAAVAGTTTAELAVPATAGPAGTVTVPTSARWPAASWAVANAERLQLVEVFLAGWRWTPAGGWATDPEVGGVPLTLRLAT
jgi:hypothetical protein